LVQRQKCSHGDFFYQKKLFLEILVGYFIIYILIV